MTFESKMVMVSTLLRAVPPVLLTLTCAGVAQAQEPAPVIQIADPCPAPPVYRTFSFQEDSNPVGVWEPFIESNPAATWSASAPPSLPAGTTACGGSGDTWTCAGLSVTLPPPTPLQAQTPAFVDAAGPPTATSQMLRVTANNGGGDECSADFTFKATLAGGGWGDPHLTTVDGIHYDFQSAGEFTALREGGFEVQTRQSPVPTASVPITNPYTGITHCVAIFTAVATKIGSSRVTVQPSPGAEPDPNSMQVRVDGKVVKLGDEPYLVYAEGNPKSTLDGTIIKRPDGMYEITDAHGTQVVVTSKYWQSRKVWYLNLNIYGTSARQGTMGKLGAHSWLPSLPDGSSLGEKPESASERYQVLYEKFADAWRVTDETSLFDYEPGTNTATFTLDEWPRNDPKSCAIEGESSAEPATEEVAAEACANVVNAVQRADCEFDVMVTGEAGFGESYEVMQRFTPRPPGWYSPVPSKDRECPKCPACEECPAPPQQAWWTHWIVIALGIVLLVLLLVLVLRGRKQP